MERYVGRDPDFCGCHCICHCTLEEFSLIHGMLTVVQYHSRMLLKA